MSVKTKDIALVHRVVGTKHVYTSPDVPELHVSHAEKEVAYASIQSALDLLEKMKARLAQREAMDEVVQERLYA